MLSSVNLYDLEEYISYAKWEFERAGIAANLLSMSISKVSIVLLRAGRHVLLGLTKVGFLSGITFTAIFLAGINQSGDGSESLDLQSV